MNLIRIKFAFKSNYPLDNDFNFVCIIGSRFNRCALLLQQLLDVLQVLVEARLPRSVAGAHAGVVEPLLGLQLSPDQLEGGDILACRYIWD